MDFEPRDERQEEREAPEQPSTRREQSLIPGIWDDSGPESAEPTGGVMEDGHVARQGAPAVSAIVAVCVVVFLASFGMQLIPDQFLLFSPGRGLVFPGIITHIFAHASVMHLLGNMIVLYFLGAEVERTYGTGRFLVLYFAAGLFAALAEGAVHPDGLLLGASGAIAGIMAVFVRHYPRAMLYLYAVLPIPAWLFMLLWVAYNLWGAAAGGQFNIAFSAHLGGFFAGLLLSFLQVKPVSARVKS